MWRGPRKLCAIGIACSRWHTSHGLALNVDVDLRAYDAITPCGIEAGGEEGRGVGNVRAEVEGEEGGGDLGPQPMERVRRVVVEQFGEVMGFDVQHCTEPVDVMLDRWDRGQWKGGGAG